MCGGDEHSFMYKFIRLETFVPKEAIIKEIHNTCLEAQEKGNSIPNIQH